MKKLSATTKFLALMPLVVLGAACNGNSPVGPSPIADDTMSTAMPNALATSKSVGPAPSACNNISAVNLVRVPSTSFAGILVEATYVNLGGGSVRCAAPVWTSSPRGVLTPVLTNQQNVFRNRVNSNLNVTVTATAPNGVSASLLIQGSAAALSIGPSLCPGVTGVKLARMSMTSTSDVVIQATYLGLGSSTCGAPAFTSNPRGVLAVQPDLFRVGVRNQSGPVNVTATAPNGMTASIEVRGIVTALSIGPSACPGVTGVKLSRMQLTPTSDLVIQATYQGLGSSTCAAPAFTSNPRGVLAAQPDLFRIGVHGHTGAVTITATAPNGLAGQIQVR
jgi:hypothetical protein